MVNEISQSHETTPKISQATDMPAKCMQLQLDTKSLLNAVSAGWADLDAHIALHNQRLRLLSDLWKFSGDINAANDNLQAARDNLESLEGKGWTPLTLEKVNAAFLDSVQRGNASRCFKLLQTGARVRADSPERRSQVLSTAAYSGNTAVCDALLRWGVDPTYVDPCVSAPLHVAARYGYIDLCRLLLAYGVDVNRDCRRERTALHQAAAKNRIEMCEELLRSGASVYGNRSRNSATALHWAAGHGHWDITLLLLASTGLSTEECLRDGTLLRTVASNGRVQIFLELLALGANAVGKTRAGATALHGAAGGGHKDMVQTLLDLGADVNDQDIYGQSPLHLAAQNGHEGICRTLLELGAKIHDLDKLGRTALHRAAGHGQVSACVELLRAGADIHCRDKAGYTALARAVKRERSRTQMVLVAYGADTNVSHAAVLGSPNCLAMSPLEAATRLGNSQAMIEVFDMDTDPSTFAARVSAAIPLTRDTVLADLMNQQATKIAAVQAISSSMAVAAVIPPPPIQLAMAHCPTNRPAPIHGVDPVVTDNDGKPPAKVADESNSGAAAAAIRAWLSREAAMNAVAELCLE